MHSARSQTPELQNGQMENGSLGRKYMAAVDRALATFDTIESWPDNISFLNRLLKAVQLQPSFVLPHTFEVSSCLALCLAPKLPSGVHIRALEVYSYIFSSRQNLDRDLALFLTGLTPLLGYASITVKNAFITLLSTFITPLGRDLRPCSTALILALLPALEDEHDEGFLASLQLMDDIKAALDDPTVFWSSLWLSCVSVGSNQRSGVLNYLLRRMPIAGKVETTQAEHLSEQFTQPDVSLFVRSFSAGLTDESNLIQRGFLELLITHIKLSSPLFKSLRRSDSNLLLFSATQIVLRRDVGLNRRLWHWLEDGGVAAKQSTYFKTHVQDNLTQALLAAIQDQPVKASKVCLSLLDREEIGGLMVDTLFPAFILVTYQHRGQSHFPALVISTNAIFQAVSPSVVFGHLHMLCDKRDFTLAIFVLDTFAFEQLDNIEDELRKLFTKQLTQIDCESLRLQLLLRLSVLLQPKMLQSTVDDSCMQLLKDTAEMPALLSVCDNVTSNFGKCWFVLNLRALTAFPEESSLLYQLLEHRLKLQNPDSEDCSLSIETADDLLVGSSPGYLPFEHLRGLSRLILTCIEVTDITERQSFFDICRKLVKQCWQYIGAYKLKYEIESVSLMSKLISVIPSSDADSFVALLVSQELCGLNPVEKFAALWTHYASQDNRDLLHTSVILVLDHLVYGDSLKQTFILQWLQTTSTTANHLLNFLLKPIYLQIPQKTHYVSASSQNLQLRTNDVHMATYLLGLLCFLLSKAGTRYLRALEQNFVIQDFDVPRYAPEDAPEEPSVLSIFQNIATSALLIDLRDDPNARSFYEHCLEIIDTLAEVNESYLGDLEKILTRKLSLSIENKQYALQQLFLSHLRVTASRSIATDTFEQDLALALIEGICQTRQHPVLQDYLIYLTHRSTLRQHLDRAVLQMMVECIIEQTNLDLIDIDLVLTTRSGTETNATYANILLLLDALETLGLKLFGGMPNRASQDSLNAPRASLIKTTFLFGATKDEDDSAVISDTDSSTLLSSIVCTTANVWLWASRNSSEPSLATTYISKILLARSFELLSNLSHGRNIPEMLNIFVSLWSSSTDDNRLGIQKLCNTLYGQDQFSLLCKLIKGNLSFSVTQSKKSKEEFACHTMSYTCAIAMHASDEESSIAFNDIVALMRHLILYIPFKGPGNVTLLELTSILCSKAIRTTAGQQKKLKRELTETLVRVYAAATSPDLTQYLDGSLARTLENLVPKLAQTLLDLDKTSSVLTIILTNIIQPRVKSKVFSLSSVGIFRAVAELDGFKKLWKRDLTEFFSDPTFFDSPVEQAESWCRILQIWAHGEQDKVNEYLAKLNTNTPGHLFVSVEAERQQRIMQLRQISMLIVSMPVDSNVDRIPVILSRIQEAMQGKPALISEGLILLQTLVLQISPIHLKSTWIVLTLELHRGFLCLLNSVASVIGSSDLLRSVLRTLDIMLYLAFEDFQVHKWIFITDTTEIVHDPMHRISENLVGRLSKHLGSEYQGSSFKSLLRTPDALETTVGDYVRNVSLLFYEWNQNTLGRPNDSSRARAEILCELFKTS